MNCDIYKVINQKGTYLFIETGNQVADKVPDKVLKKLGHVQFFKSIGFDQNSPLIAANPVEIIDNIKVNGFHIQDAEIKIEEVSEADAEIGGEISTASRGLGPLETKTMNTQYLIHFTGRGRTDQDAYDILKKILYSSELLMSYCPTFAKEAFEKRFMMACLTDPDKVDINRHRQIFGNFAVAFNKEPMVKYGANPVLYVTSENLVHFRSQMGLLRRFEDLNKDRDWKEEEQPYQFTENELLSFYFTAGLSQEIEYRGEKDNYFQSEWRILYQPDLFLGHGKEDKPGMIRPSSLNGKIVGYLKFDAPDVAYILVPKNYEDRTRNDFPNIEVKTA